MTIYKQIVKAYLWWKRTSDQGLFASGIRSERTLNTAVRSEDGDRAMVYLSSPGSVSIHLDKIATRRARAEQLSLILRQG
jgi:hypothetical protein